MSEGWKKNSQPDVKDQQIADLKDQLSQALEFFQKQQKQIEGLYQTVAQLHQEIKDLKRIVKSQATPFAWRHRVEKPRLTGREVGKGKFAH